MLASDFRLVARSALRGFWGASIGMYIILTLLTALISGVLSVIPTVLFVTLQGSGSDEAALIVMLVLSLIISIIMGFITSMFALGYIQFFINVITRESTPTIGTLFSKKSMAFKAFGMYFQMTIRVFLWSLLLYFPGIIAIYRYSMAAYILA